MKAVYTSDKFLPDGDSVNIWFQMLQDLDYKSASAAIQQYMLTNKFPPTIADIREIAVSINQGEEPDWGDGWEQVLMAIRRFGMYQEGLALESMDEITRTCVKRLGFRNLCLSENINHDRANFRMIYEQLQERKKKDSQLSLPVKELIQQIQMKGVQQIEGKTIPDAN